MLTKKHLWQQVQKIQARAKTRLLTRQSIDTLYDAMRAVKRAVKNASVHIYLDAGSVPHTYRYSAKTTSIVAHHHNGITTIIVDRA